MKGTDSLQILLIDDDITQYHLLKTLTNSITEPVSILSYETDPLVGIERAGKETFDLIITDYNMIGANGHEVFLKVKLHNPDIPVVIITSEDDIELAVNLMKSGVYDFWVKPFKLDILERTLLKVLDHNLLVKEIDLLKKRVHEDFCIDSIIGKSKPMLDVIDTIGRCSEHNINVLIRGESGTGKELVAQALHHSSPRANAPFVIVNIAALSESLIESELFGHVKGAFTGAERDRIGRFEEAHGGTLFIDEIGDVSPAVQIKLLRAIQFRQFQRIGENKTRDCDVRILSATSRNLEKMMEESSFRQDLYYRLNVVTITVPSLRDRKTDIPLLMEHFFKHMEGSKGIGQKQVSKEAMHQLMSYDYPGNVRELENILEQAAVFSRGSHITTRDLPVHLQALVGSETQILLDGSYQDQMDSYEKALLERALDDSGGNQSEAARKLEITERRLRYRMEKLGITSKSQKE